MELTRYWRAQHNGADIEVQWTGFRLHGGWILRLLINGELKAEQKVRRYVQDFELKDGSITINFWGKLFRHRCKISADGLPIVLYQPFELDDDSIFSSKDEPEGRP